MIADWFDASHTGNPMSALPVVAIVNLTILFLLACAAHAILGRRRALIRSGLWNAVLLASILQPVVMLGLPRLRIACLPSREFPPSWPNRPRSPGSTNRPTIIRNSKGFPMPVVTSAERSDPVRSDSRLFGEGRSRGISAPSVLMGIYAAGVVILSLRLIRLPRRGGAVEADGPGSRRPILDRPPGVLAGSPGHRSTGLSGPVGSRANPDVAGLAPAGDRAPCPAG